jgi:phosphate transport system substrate-binding protein
MVGSLLAVMAPAAQANTDLNSKSRLIVGSGSDTTYLTMQRLDLIFNNATGCNILVVPGQPQPLDGECITPTPDGQISINENHDVATSAFPYGSSSGINQLCQQGLANVAQIDYARSSRTLRSTDCDGLEAVAYARDALSWYHFTEVDGQPTASAAVDNLTQSQLNKIFVTGEITNWSQVGGEDAPIVVYAAQSGSGTRASWDSFVGGDSSSQIPADKKDERVIREHDGTPILDNGEAENAIFYYGFGRYTQAPEGNSTGVAGAFDELGQIDGVTPTNATVGNQTFPGSRDVFNVLRYPTEATRNFTDAVDGFLCRTDIDDAINPFTGKTYRTEIEQAIKSEGLVPIPKGNTGGGTAAESYCRLSIPKPDVTSATTGFTAAGAGTLMPSVTVTFSEQVTGATGANIKLLPQGGKAVKATVTCVDAAGEAAACSGTVAKATITPRAKLIANRAYQVKTNASILDRAGNASAPSVFDWNTPKTFEDDSATYGPFWGSQKIGAASGGTVTQSAWPGEKARVKFVGGNISVGYIAGPARGRIQLFVDGSNQGTVSQYAASTNKRSVNLTGLGGGSHTLEIVVLGTKEAASAGTSVNVDSFSIS